MELRKQIDVAMFYEREMTIYNDLFVAYRRLQNEANISDPFDAYPKCYETVNEPNCQLIVMENLKTQGYVVIDRKLPMKPDHVRLVMKECGKFHGTGFALSRIDPTINDLLRDKMKRRVDEVFVSMSPTIAKCVDDLIVTYDSTIDVKTIDYLTGLRDQVLDYFRRVGDETTVIVHGDFWTMNMMFKYDEVMYDQISQHCYVKVTFKLTRLRLGACEGRGSF